MNEMNVANVAKVVVLGTLGVSAIIAILRAGKYYQRAEEKTSKENNGFQTAFCKEIAIKNAFIAVFLLVGFILAQNLIFPLIAWIF